MNPLEMTKSLSSRLENYIRELLPLEKAMPEFSPELDSFYRKNPFADEPFLEWMPVYEIAKKNGRQVSLREIAEDGVILPETAELFAAYFHTAPEKVFLYQHQYDALCAYRENKNIIITTGTGSGKTESFLIPVIDRIFRIKKENPDARGIKAMILYPMNALVNDQLQRLRKLLSPAVGNPAYPTIRFGKYTGELEYLASEKKICDVPQEFQRKFQKLEQEKETLSPYDEFFPIPGEVTRRSEWHENPADIMITNYSMLEFLLLRPETQRIFESPWHYIVLDEAHCYTGSLGTELAWLLRRVKRRLNAPKGLRLIAASATLISDKSKSENEAKSFISNEFAIKLFRSEAPFEVIFSRYAKLIGEENVEAPIPSSYLQILNTVLEDRKTLLQATQDLLALEMRIRKIDVLLPVIRKCIQNEGTLPIGELLVVWKNIDALAGSPLFPEYEKMNFCLRETPENLSALSWLLSYCEKMIAPYDYDDLEIRNIWRNYLHEPADSREAEDGQRKGNRLTLLKQFSQFNLSPHLSNMNRETLYWLVKAAYQMDQTTAIRLGILSLRMSCSEEMVSVMKTFLSDFHELQREAEKRRRSLSRIWFSVLQLPPSEEPFEFGITQFFQGNVHFSKLLRYFQANQDILERNSAGKYPQQFSAVASAVFDQPFSSSLAGELDALIQLASLGRLKDYGNLLLTIRYHQLLSGMENIGISFPDGKNPLNVEFHSGVRQLTEDRHFIFWLGICPECGEPFLLGYLDTEIIPRDKDVYLSRFQTENSIFLHAFSIFPGRQQGNSVEDFTSLQCSDSAPASWQKRDLFLDLKSGMISENSQRITNPIRIRWHISPRVHRAKNRYNEFLPECPRCRYSSNRQENHRFGAIVPYAANRNRLRMVALDHLLYMTPSSRDPVTASYPGEGRKVLCFSDSRNGAAQLAYQYQEFSRKRILLHLLTYALDSLDQLERVEDQAFLEELFQIYWDNPNTFLPEHQGKPRNILLLAAALLLQAKKQNAARLFDLTMPFPSTENPEKNAALYLLLETLRGTERNLKFFNRILSVKSLALEAYCYSKLHSALKNLGTKTIPTEIVLKRISYAIYFYLFRSCQLEIAKYGFEWISKIIVDHDGFTLSACTFDRIRNATSLKNLITAEFHITESQDIEAILQTFWKEIFQPNESKKIKKLFSEPRPDFAVINSRTGAFNLLDLYFEKGTLSQEEQKTPARCEQESFFLLKNGNIPARIEEHSAQLDKSLASAYQNAFSEGLVNILSCSTTFEMGVDLGELSTVFLGNMPPGVSNYRQRAGRAGRRPGMPAYMVTFIGENSHDQYFKDHAPELLFGAVPCPSVYLDNPIYRARHLRSEAFHDFLMNYADISVQATDRTNKSSSRKLSWELVSDFFIGGRISKRKLLSVFPPLISFLRKWHENEEKTHHLQKYLSTIDDADHLDYSVSTDFCWQMLDQSEGDIIAPYRLLPNYGTIAKYQDLGGCHLPVLGKGKITLERENLSRMSLQRRIMQTTLAYNNDKDILDFNVTLENAASHLFYNSVITWLARNRILPKYGFPVDVTVLKIENDTALNLERDMRLGLFEYAPGQKLVADKRLYESTQAVAWKKGVHDPAHKLHDSYYVTFYECPHCHDLSLLNTPCPSGHIRHPRQVFKPDAFLGKRIFSRMQIANVYIPRVHVYTGGIRENSAVQIPGTHLSVAASDTNTLQYINKGGDFKNSGFEIHQTRCWLMHEVSTDIALWLYPDIKKADLCAQESALEAIVAAASLVLKIEPRDLGGILHCFDKQNAFILFDASIGGSGVVHDLILQENDSVKISMREILIRRILEKAIEICKRCPECEKSAAHFHTKSGSLLTASEFNKLYGDPVEKNKYLKAAPKDQKRFRMRQACYHCLCSYANQKKHDLLDRVQAVSLLEYLLDIR